MIAVKISIIVLILMIFCPAGQVVASPQQADEYWNRALTLLDNGQYLEAAEMFAKSAEAELASDEPRWDDLSIELFNAGYYYYKVNLYEQSLFYFELALEVDKGLNKEERIVRDYNNIGMIYDSWGEYEKALDYYQQALAINQRLGIEEEIAIQYNNIGGIYDSLGQYQKALEYYNKSLDQVKEMGLDEYIAGCYNNIAGTYYTWGENDKALEYYNYSLNIVRKLKLEEYEAVCYSNIGSVYKTGKNYEKALEYHQQALEIFNKVEQIGNVATTLNKIGLIYFDWYQNKKALDYFEEAMKIEKSIGRKSELATCYNYIGEVYNAWGQYEKALEFYEKALEIDKNLGREGNLAADYNNIGYLYAYLNQIEESAKYFLKSIEIIEKIRGKAPTIELQRSYLASQINTYQALIYLYIKDRQLEKAFEIMELSKAKVLSESLSRNVSDLVIPKLQGVQQELVSGQGLLIYANSNWKNIVEMSVTADNIQGIIINKREFIDNIKLKYGDQIAKIVKRKERIKELQSMSTMPTDILLKKQEGDRDFENIINYYRELLINGQDCTYLSRELYKLLIKPLEQKIGSKDELVIVPD